MKYWEDFKVGESIELGSHSITEAEILAFARKYDPQPFHTDPEAARRSIFGGLIASGWHTCALMMRLSVEANRREDAAATGSPGLDSCRWLKPVRPGDTLTGRSEVLETWPSEASPSASSGAASSWSTSTGEVGGGDRRDHDVPPPAHRRAAPA